MVDLSPKERLFLGFMIALIITSLIVSFIALFREPTISKDQSNQINQGINKIIKTSAAASANASVTTGDDDDRVVFFDKSSGSKGNLTKKDIVLQSYTLGTSDGKPEFIEIGKIDLNGHTNPILVFSHLYISFESILTLNSDGKQLSPFFNHITGEDQVLDKQHHMTFANVDFAYRIVENDVPGTEQIMHGFHTMTRVGNHKKKEGELVEYTFEESKPKSVQVHETFSAGQYASFGIRIWHRARDMTKGYVSVKGLKAHTDDTFAT